ncbi:ABC transporter [Microbacterium sp. G2-8]|uniref:ABC transporter n=1 Tax=Microbacterium sp. G2-8 TaxID=2842454 RepID=UPI001C894D36|nr:ABC transporter [Microbacterium sp. G2-8]
MTRRLLPIATLSLAAIALAGCAGSEPAAQPVTTPTAADEPGHGDVEGAEEVGEPQSALLSVSAAGEVGLLDLLTDDAQELGAVGEPNGVASDGRFAFVTTVDGLEVVDSGVWTWDHGDHSHYYRADPSLVGSVPGSGTARISTPPLATAGTTGVFFEGSGEAVALDMAALAGGEVRERLRVDTGAETGVVAPVGEFTIVAHDDTAHLYDADGELVSGADEACTDPQGAITTRVGTVVGCEDGALLAVATGDEVEIEHLAYPSDAPRATEFAGRKNRPTVAGQSDDSSFWLLDTRAREWTHVEVDAHLTTVVAADDADENIVAVDDDGRVRVYGPDGSERGSTEPLAGEGSTLTVDTQRAYLSAPDAGVIYEIDYADGARIARELTTPTAPDAAIEVGR